MNDVNDIISKILQIFTDEMKGNTFTFMGTIYIKFKMCEMKCKIQPLADDINVSNKPQRNTL